MEIVSKKEFTELIHVVVDKTVIKAYNSNQNIISKKEGHLLVQYYKRPEVNPKKLEKLNKPAQNIKQ